MAKCLWTNELPIGDKSRSRSRSRSTDSHSDIPPPPPPQPFYCPFSGTTRVSRCQKKICFWTLWCKGRSTEAETSTIWLGATPSGLTSAHLHHPPIFYRPDALPAAQPTVSKHWRQSFRHTDRQIIQTALSADPCRLQSVCIRKNNVQLSLQSLK